MGPSEMWLAAFLVACVVALDTDFVLERPWLIGSIVTAFCVGFAFLAVLLGARICAAVMAI